MDLSGKSALVTGASSGIGEAVARALAKEGCTVTLLARRADRLESIADAIRAAGGKALVCAADVCDEAQLQNAFDEAQRHWGRLDILVNNAGIGRSSPLLSGETNLWREMVEVNLLSLAVAQREAVARFDPKSGGHIVNVSSLSGHRVPSSGGFYSATKFAVRAMTEALRFELRHAGNPTRVSQVSPGFVRTEFHSHLGEEDQAQLQNAWKDVRLLTADDIASSVMHLLSAPDHVAIHDVLLRSNDQIT